MCVTIGLGGDEVVVVAGKWGTVKELHLVNWMVTLFDVFHQSKCNKLL